MIPARAKNFIENSLYLLKKDILDLGLVNIALFIIALFFVSSLLGVSYQMVVLIIVILVAFSLVYIIIHQITKFEHLFDILLFGLFFALILYISKELFLFLLIGFLCSLSFHHESDKRYQYLKILLIHFFSVIFSLFATYVFYKIYTAEISKFVPELSTSSSILLLSPIIAMFIMIYLFFLLGLFRRIFGEKEYYSIVKSQHTPFRIFNPFIFTEKIKHHTTRVYIKYIVFWYIVITVFLLIVARLAHLSKPF